MESGWGLVGSVFGPVGVHFESSWGLAGVPLGSSWGPVGVWLGSGWCPLGVWLGSSWGLVCFRLGLDGSVSVMFDIKTKLLTKKGK